MYNLNLVNLKNNMKKIILSILAVSVLFGFIYPGFSQGGKAIDISYSNKPLSEVLKDLANKFGVDIVLSNDANQSITCSVKNVSIEDALNLVLCGTNFDFTKPNSGKNTYLIFKTEKSNCRIGKASKIFPLANLEARYVKGLFSDKLKAITRSLDEQNSIIAEGTYNDLKEIEKFIEQIDIPVKQVELEVKVIELQRNALRDIRVFRDSLSFNTIGTGIRQGQQIGVVATQQIIGPPLDKGFLIGNIAKGLSIFDFSSDTWNIFNRQLSFLETKGIVHLHAYPKVISLSGRTAAININQDNNLILGSALGVDSGRGEDISSRINIGVATTQNVGTIMAGTNLYITPVVGKENLITTNLKIEFSESSDERTRQNDVSVPTTTFRRQINTDVQVKDGQTVAIGGLVINNNSVNRRGLPFITRVPIFGDLLSNRRSTKDERELIVLITPRIRDLTTENIHLRKLSPSFIDNQYVEPQGTQTNTKRPRKFLFLR